MSLHLFTVPLFLLLLMCYTYGPVCAANTAQQKSIGLFLPGQTKVPASPVGTSPVQDVKFFSSPFLVAADGVMAAFAVARYPLYVRANTDIVLRVIETEGKNWAEKVTGDSGRNWRTHLIIQKESDAGYFFDLRKPVAVAKDDKIYLVAVNSKRKEGTQSGMHPEWNFELSVGDVKFAGGSQGTEKTIEWRTPKLLNSSLTEQFGNYSLDLYVGGLYGFLTEDRNIVFVANVLKGYDEVFAIIHLNDTGKEMKWDISYFEVAEGCEYPFVFGWNKKLIGISSCSDGSHKVEESTDLGKTWTVADVSTSRVFDTLQDKRDFTTLTIDNRTVLLFTVPRKKQTGYKAKHDIDFWMTDGNRLIEIGPIFASVGPFDFGGLLYRKGKLFFLYEKVYNAQEAIFIARLEEELEKIKSVLKTWAKTDEYLLKSCKETTTQGPSSETFCITPMSTDALVGFLSNTSSDNNNIWHDEYLFMNATVKGGTKVKNGFTFNGIGSGAQWPIGKQGQDQQYNFARYGLTVVATVTIHEVPNSDTPLLTINRVNEKECLGLWYGKDKRWKVNFKKDKVTAGAWETNQTYQLLLIVHHHTFLVCVDGKPLGKPLQISDSGENLLDIEHIFIGGHGDNNAKSTVSHVTVTNVFLYNRPFSNTIEFEAPSMETAPHAKPTSPSEGTLKPTSPSEGTLKPTGPSEKTLKPTSPSEGTLKPTSPSEGTLKPTGPSEGTLKPTGPSEGTLKPTSPSEGTLKPTGPSEKTLKPTSPSEGTLKPTGPSEGTLKPTGPSEGTLKPTGPSEGTLKPTSPSEGTLKPTSPSEGTLKPTGPSEGTLKPTGPSEGTLKPTGPSEGTLKPTSPSEGTLKPTGPSEKTLKPTSPSEGTLKPTSPSEGTLKPTSPSEGTLKPTGPSEKTLKPTSPSEGTLKPTSPSEGTLKPTGPSEKTLKPTSPSEGTLKPTSPSEGTLKPTGPSEKTLKPTSPSEGTLKPTGPSEKTLKPTSPSEGTLKPTSPSEKTLKPTGPSEGTLKPTSPSEDGSVHVQVGVTILCLLSLWGFAALC